VCVFFSLVCFVLLHLNEGATIVPFTIHCFDELRLAHTTTILSEMRACMTPFLPMAHNLGAMANMSLDLGSAFDAVTYVQSQKIRTWGLKYFNSLFETQFDIIVSPTTAALPPRFHLADDMHHGVSDAETLLATMCFVFIANLLGTLVFDLLFF
jgi:Asp-tRNA(Asn)/Glu-tRNA(Gln) amidotransferase A subunit family amidase